MKFDCPVCDGRDCVSATISPRGMYPWKINCKGPGCEGLDRGDWLRACAEAVGAPGGGDILSDPREWLTPASPPPTAMGDGISRGVFPSTWDVEQRSKALINEKHSIVASARRWLRADRGIHPDIWEVAKVGWARGLLWFPLFQDGQLVNVKTRAPGAGQMKAWHGRSVFPLYPDFALRKVDDENGAWLSEGYRLILCAGELDALCAFSHSPPVLAVSVTSGASDAVRTADQWAHRLRERNVLIAFDKGEEGAADSVGERLLSEGCLVDIIDWGDKPKGYDLTDFLLELRREPKTTDEKLLDFLRGLPTDDA